MKTTTFIAITLLCSCFELRAQESYDFLLDPTTTGWTYYSNTASGGFSYLAGQGAINYSITTSTGSQFYHRNLANALTGNYCASFKISPGANNYNTFFPLLLTESEQAGPHFHPWRENPIGQSAGPMQDLDLIGIEVLGMEIRFVHRNNDLLTANTIQSLSPAFSMSDGGSYWITLQVTNGTSAEVRVYTDAAQTQEVASGTYTIPALENLTHLYIANGNGNSFTDQYGTLDDYSINRCFLQTPSAASTIAAQLYPNPTTGSAFLRWDVPLEETGFVRVTDRLGRVVFSATVTAGEQQVECSTSDFESGIYQVEMATAGRFVRKELVVVR